MIDMSNISKRKREALLSKLEELKKNLNDDEMVAVINEVESELNRKKYGLVWEEHEERVDIEMQTKIPVFTEVKDKEIKTVDENKYNFLLEGDNLHSLKLLEKTHKGKIDVIYIDPPYNRGKSDFIYDDDYINKEDGYMHSKWLSFMEKRLMLAKYLLSNNGLIFISIDDNEYANLKLLCEDIFGSENYINTFIWKRSSSVKTEKDKFTISSEYILLFSKSRLFTLNSTFKPLADATVKSYNKNDNDGRGKYASISLQKPKDPGPETTYDYTDESGKIWACPKNGWRMSRMKVKKLELDNRLILNGTTLRVKDYWNERESFGKRIDTLWNDLPENTKGTSELKEVLNKNYMFNNPKPTALIKRCLEISSKNALVLDFFAGSGTTAHAVLELNKEDNGNRKFILATNNQNNICEDITYQRIKNVIQGYSKYEPIESNLKYYKTEFINKSSDGTVSTQLMNHIKELIQLEHHIDIDNEQIKVVFNELELDEILAHENVENCKKLFIPSDIFTTAKQDELIEKLGIEIIEIPTYYFAEELREVNEL